MSKFTTLELREWTMSAQASWHSKIGDTNAAGDPVVFGGPIPLDAVRNRLFAWSVEEVPLVAKLSNGTELITSRKALVRTDRDYILGEPTKAYGVHDYSQWLADTVERYIGGGVFINAAGILEWGKKAWISLTLGENVQTEAGMTFLPNLLFTSSLDSTVPTAARDTATIAVCDNALAAATWADKRRMREGDVKFLTVKHTKHSASKLGDYRDAIDRIYGQIDQIAANIAALAAAKVTEADWLAVVEALVPIDPDSKRSVTVGTDRRDQLERMYRWDRRASDWNGTALGVMQAVNTWSQHDRPTRGGTHPFLRNMGELLTDRLFSADETAMAVLSDRGVLVS